MRGRLLVLFDPRVRSFRDRHRRRCSADAGPGTPLNTAAGALTLSNSRSGEGNTAFGARAMHENESGQYNTAIGLDALLANTFGWRHTAVGRHSNRKRGGHDATFIAGIRGTTTSVADAVAVVIDSNGQLGIVSSSRRVKDDIADMGDVSHQLLRVRPVTFPYTQPSADGTQPRQ
jgi:hypothetical protein